MFWEFSRIVKHKFGDTAVPGIVSWLLLLFPICIGNNKLPYIWSGICDAFFNLSMGDMTIFEIDASKISS